MEESSPAAAAALSTPRSKLAPNHAAAAASAHAPPPVFHTDDEPHTPSQPPLALALSSRTPVVTPSGHQVDRPSLVRMMVQALSSLGYSASASTLQHESGVELESRELDQWRSAVLRGDWETARAKAGTLFASEHTRQVARILAEQRYLALVEQAIRSKTHPQAAAAEAKENKVNHAIANGASSHGSSHGAAPGGTQLMRAVQYLQTELVPLYAAPAGSQGPPQADPHLLHLASLFTCTSVEALREHYRGSGILPSSSPASTDPTSSVYLPLFHRLASLLPAHSHLRQENQLFRLLDHSIRAQIDECIFHHASDHQPYTFHLDQRHQCALTLPAAPLLTLRDHEDEVLSVAFSHGPSGLRLATCSKDRTLRIYALRDKKRHANGSKTNTAHSRRASNGATAHIGNGATSSTSSAASRPSSSSSIASASPSFELVCLSVLHPALTSRCTTPSPSSSASRPSSASSGAARELAAYWSVEWSSDNRHLLACNGTEASVFRADDGACCISVGACAVDHPAARALSVSGGGEAATSVENPSDSESPPTPRASGSVAGGPGRSSFPSSLAPSNPSLSRSSLSIADPAFSAVTLGQIERTIRATVDLQRMLTLGAVPRSLLFEDLASQEHGSSSAASSHEGLLGHTEPLSACVWCPDGESFVTGGLDRRLILWSLSGAILDVWAGEIVTDLVVRGDRMLAITPANRCIVFQVQDGRMEEITSFHSSGNISAVSLSADARFALLSCVRPAELHLWEIGLSEEQMECSSDPAPLAASSSPSSPSSPPSPLSPALPSPASGPALVRRFAGHHASRYIVRPCFGGPSEQLVLSGSEDGLVYVWHRGTGALLSKLRGHAATVNQVAAAQTQSSFLVASASDDHTIKLWQFDTQRHQEKTAHR